MQPVSETLRTATVLADALGLSSHTISHATMQLIQQPANEVQMEDYKFHSSDIISTLEDLQDKFKTTRQNLDADEVESVRAFDVLMQEKTHLKKMKNKFLDHSQKTKSET